MAYDLEIQTPKGRIGLNLQYLSSTLMDTVLNAWVQQPDGTWKYMGYLAFGGLIDVAGAPDAFIAKMLVMEGLATTADATAAKAWIGSRSQEVALPTIVAWLKRFIRDELVAFLNRIIGVTPGQPAPTPGPAPSIPFASSEHALRTAFKALPFQVNPTTGEISL